MTYFGITEEEIQHELKKIRTETKKLKPNLRSLLAGRVHSTGSSTNCNLCNKHKKKVDLYRACKNNNNAYLYICASCLNLKNPKSENNTCWNCGHQALEFGSMRFCYPYQRYKSHSNDKLVEMIDKIESKLITSRVEKETKEKRAQPYIDSGLAEPFAMAIIEGTNDDEVLTLWEADWWKQYPADDILIVSVLTGQHTESDGKYLNSIRSNHERLALCCVVKDVTIDWAKALIDSGFDENPDAVNSVLDGGEPRIVARIRKMKVDSDLLPPGLGKSVSVLENLKHTKIDNGNTNPTESHTSSNA